VSDSGQLSLVIVDDEAPARALLREYLAAETDVELVAECENGFEAVKAVADHRPDVLLLDVQMPKLSGFEVLELLDPCPAVIFTTAHDDYALAAFEVHAVDYLLKPFSRERLAEALQRVRENRASRPPLPRAELVDAARPAGAHLSRILVRSGSRIHVIAIDDVDFVEARDDRVRIRVGAEEHDKTEKLGRLETQLDPSRFVRIHRSYILNLDRLAKVELYAKDSRHAILHDGRKLPVSRAGYARLRELL